MNPPVEYVKVSAKGREILIRIKRNTGLENWNEICRIALCRSLANPSPPPKFVKTGDSAIDMDWKTFAGLFQEELAAHVIFRAIKDGIELSHKDLFAPTERNFQDLNCSQSGKISFGCCCFHRKTLCREDSRITWQRVSGPSIA